MPIRHAIRLGAHPPSYNLCRIKGRFMSQLGKLSRYATSGLPCAGARTERGFSSRHGRLVSRSRRLNAKRRSDIWPHLKHARQLLPSTAPVAAECGASERNSVQRQPEPIKSAHSHQCFRTQATNYGRLSLEVASCDPRCVSRTRCERVRKPLATDQEDNVTKTRHRGQPLRRPMFRAIAGIICDLIMSLLHVHDPPR